MSIQFINKGKGIDTSDATATAEDILIDRTAYADGKKISGTYDTSKNITKDTAYSQIVMNSDLSDMVNYILQCVSDGTYLTRNLCKAIYFHEDKWFVIISLIPTVAAFYYLDHTTNIAKWNIYLDPRFSLTYKQICASIGITNYTDFIDRLTVDEDTFLSYTGWYSYEDDGNGGNLTLVPIEGDIVLQDELVINIEETSLRNFLSTRTFDVELSNINIEKDLLGSISSITTSYFSGIRAATSDATATENNILKDKTAYVDGEKITGTLEMEEYNAKTSIVLDTGSSSLPGILSCIQKITNLSINTNNLSYLFYNCTRLEEISFLDTSQAINTEQMFFNCKNLRKISNLNTSNATQMNSTFAGCSNLEEILELDTSNATSLGFLFKDCTNLKRIPSLNTSNATYMTWIFTNCQSLQSIPQIDTSKITDMSLMFNNCKSITEIPLLNSSKVTNMSQMFSGCSKLTTVPLFDTNKVTNILNMFLNCTSLSETSLNNILSMCINAISYTGTKTLKVLGLSSTQATTCQGLSNYQAFLDAGWTTGY